MAGPVPPRCLDLTRLVSRAGRVPTGVDRVELAYLSEFLDADLPLWALVRTRIGFLLLGPEAVPRLAAVLRGDARPGRADLLSRLMRRGRPAHAAAESLARRLATARIRRGALARGLARACPEGLAYYNVGLANLTDEVLGAVRQLPGGRASVMIHDTIPLDFPKFARPGVPERFAAILDRTARLADRVICNSHQTARDVARHAHVTGQVIVAPLGVRRITPDPDALAAVPLPEGPLFLALGTIEPRKEIGFLLDLWEGSPPPAATLVLCGTRGWRNEAVFARLDRGIAGVIEAPGLSDGAVAALMMRARALLLPSQAEGYGLPALEAAALGCPVIARDLPIWREVLGDAAAPQPGRRDEGRTDTGVYVTGNDAYEWRKQIDRRSLDPAPRRPDPVPPPTWAEHFKIVLSPGW